MNDGAFFPQYGDKPRINREAAAASVDPWQLLRRLERVFHAGMRGEDLALEDSQVIELRRMLSERDATISKLLAELRASEATVERVRSSLARSARD